LAQELQKGKEKVMEAILTLQKGINISQWDIKGQLQKELDNLKYYYQRQADFWEWLENEKDLNNEELFNEFEKWEEERELLETNK